MQGMDRLEELLKNLEDMHRVLVKIIGRLERKRENLGKRMESFSQYENFFLECDQKCSLQFINPI